MGFNSKPFEEKHQKCSTWPFLPLSVLPRLCPCPMVTQRQLDPQLMAPLCINQLLPHLHTNLPLHQPTNTPPHPVEKLPPQPYQYEYGVADQYTGTNFQSVESQ